MPRPRKPTSLKLVKGTAQNCRLNPNEPQPKRGIPIAPEHLSERAREAWPRIAAMLDRMGVLTEVDGLVLEGLCSTYAELVSARRSLAERGETSYMTTTQQGDTMYRPYPEVAMVSDLDKRFRVWLAAVGLTPADRSKVNAVLSGEKTADPWDKLAQTSG